MSYGVIYDLTLTYSGNQLVSVSDAAIDEPTAMGAQHFHDGASTGTEYTYDANGNMTKDANSSITSITYDINNQPDSVRFSNMEAVRYYYDAMGNRLGSDEYTQPTHTGAGLSLPALRSRSTRRFCGNIIYDGSTISQILFDGGYITLNDNGSPIYHFYVTDHQGNNRLVVDAEGDVEERNDYYPYGSLMSSSTTSIQRFKYNGKELSQHSYMLWYDYMARQTMPILGRFSSVDPLCEKYYGMSPYMYCAGNPVNAIDSDGQLIIFISGNHFGDGGSSAYWDGVDNQIMNTTLDFHAFYYDGSLGGYLNRASMSCLNRKQAGYTKGYSDASRIILAAGEESLKFVTHSMGGAFGNGFVKGLQQWAQDNNKTLPKIEYVLDIAPYQGSSIEVAPNMQAKTIELSHSDDYIAGSKEKGIKNYHLSSSGNWLNPSKFFGHGVSTFKKDIMQWLPESVCPSFNMDRWEENKNPQ